MTDMNMTYNVDKCFCTIRPKPQLPKLQIVLKLMHSHVVKMQFSSTWTCLRSNVVLQIQVVYCEKHFTPAILQ